MDRCDDRYRAQHDEDLLGKSADYILTDTHGGSRIWYNAWIHGGPKNSEQWIGWILEQTIPPSSTDPREFRWADLDVDGRADLILITAGGGANAWINEFDSQTFQIGLRNIGQIADDKNVPPVAVHFVDVGGNSRADFVRTGLTGVTHIWLNRLTDVDLPDSGSEWLAACPMHAASRSQ